MSFTYAELKQAIQDYTECSEESFVNNINIFIKNTEERILKSTQLEVFRKNSEGMITEGDKYLRVPRDYLAPFSLSLIKDNQKEFILFKDVNFIQSFNPNERTQGVPRYYAFFDIKNFILAPTPDATYVVDLHYFYRPESLTAGAESETTWISENVSIGLLYGSLFEAYTYMKGENDLLQNYNQRFTEAISRVKTFGESQEITDAYRTGLILTPKT